MRDQFADWQAAIGFAARLPGVDPASLRSGASPPPAATSSASRRDSAARGGDCADTQRRRPGRHALHDPAGAARLTGRGVLDAVGGLGRPPLLVPLVGEPGRVAVLTTAAGRDGGRVLNHGNRYPDWQQAVAACSTLRLGSYRPGRYASRARCAAGPGVRPGSAALVGGPPSTRRSKDPAGSRSGYPAGTTSRSWQPRAGHRGQAVLPAPGDVQVIKGELLPVDVQSTYDRRHRDLLRLRSRSPTGRSTGGIAIRAAPTAWRTAAPSRLWPRWAH